MSSRGDLFIVSAPSGAGKTTLISGLEAPEVAATGRLHIAVSHTTRAPRASEIEGRHYHFVDRETFQEMIAAGRFLEWAVVHGNLYGTAVEEVGPYLEEGVDVLLDIDVQGAESVLAAVRDPGTRLAGVAVHTVFILPPSYGALVRRLESRGLDDPGAIARRLGVSQREMAHVGRYDYVIVNDDARVASRVLTSILLDKRHRRERLQPALERILSDFRRHDAPRGPG
ncbi:MAG TPA: guanylate kinase [Thermoanaerobaculia bacterium]|nr:guanylate kinase [Thermoanaerobaculia bacterium]